MTADPTTLERLVRADARWARRQGDEPALPQYLSTLAEAVSPTSADECRRPHRDPGEPDRVRALSLGVRRVYDAAVEAGLVDGGDPGTGWAERLAPALRDAGRLLAEHRARIDALTAELAARPPALSGEPERLCRMHAYDVDEHGRPQPCRCGHVHPWVAAALRRGEAAAPVLELRSAR